MLPTKHAVKERYQQILVLSKTELAVLAISNISPIYILADLTAYHSLLHNANDFYTLSSPEDGLLVIWDKDTRSEYMDLPPLLVEGLKPELTEAIEVSLPSESYLPE